MTFIIVKTNFEAMHFWSEATQKVAFLKNLHRHIFFVEVKMEVTELDREIEFFTLKKVLDDYIGVNYKGLEFSKSCEMIASEIKVYLENNYNNRKISVAVFEDNENGAICE